MSSPRRDWWGYVKGMIRRYGRGAANENEREAVESAIETTSAMKDGESRLRVIGLVLLNGTHRISGAALQIPCSKRTAERWHADFIREVAKNFRCDGLF